MRLVISSIPEEGLQQKIDLPIALNAGTLESNAHVLINTFKHGDRILIDGTVKMSASFKCSRCLKEFSYPLNVSFKEEYLPSPEVSNEEQELADKSMDLNFYRDDEIDITGLIREQLLLAAPMKVLCRSDCRGICPKCGKDLNEGLCGCRDEEMDPRLTPLKKIKEALKHRKE
jgi:uncharacterized protein